MRRETRSEPFVDDYEEDEDEEYFDAEDDEEEYESDINELADVVDQVTESAEPVKPLKTPTIAVIESGDPTPLSPTVIGANNLSTLERGLAKRQSKGKYQVSNYVRN